MKTILALLITVAAAAPSRAAADEVPIVYSRCPRHHQPFTVTGPLTKNGATTMATTTVHNADLFDLLPEVARPIGDFDAPCDLVYRDGQGHEKILYSCIATSTAESACAAIGAAVSFDAKTVAFAVFRGPLVQLSGQANGLAFDPAATNTTPFNAPLPNQWIEPTESQIVLADVASGKLTPLPFPPGTQNFGPTFTSDGRITFSSSGRRQVYGPMPLCSNNSPLSIQLYAMDPDGRNVELISPESMAAELDPIQLTDGRLAVASWQMFGMLAYRHGNGFATCGTTNNFFHVYAQNPDGSDATAIFGQHLSDATNKEQVNFPTEDAAHFFGQASDGRVWKANYYRGNNFGLGAIEGFPIPPPGEEGPSVPEAMAAGTSPYRAWGEVSLAAWANNEDQYAFAMPMPPLTVPGYKDPILYAGKLGHPSGLPNNELLVSWGIGPCSTTSGQLSILAMQQLAAQAGDNPGCDVGIYRTAPLPADTQHPLAHPSALVPVVNSPDFQEFLARPVVPYQAVHGIAAPPVIPRAEGHGDAALPAGTPFGVLGASSIIHRETHPPGPIEFNAHQASVVGTDMVEYGDDELCGVRILAVYANRKVESYWHSTSTVGERVGILGELPVRHFDAAGKPILDALGEQDTSFKVRFAADTPYLMEGIDCQGRALNTDLTWQALRPGEVKTCNGCHVHSGAATALPFADTLAGRGQVPTSLLGGGKVPLLTGGSGPNVTTKEIDGWVYMVELERDIMPILQRRCVSCHGGATAAAGLRLDLPRDPAKVNTANDDSTYFRLALDWSQQYVPANLRYTSAVHGSYLDKPNLSKYVRMMNARGSLLYWKAANQRTDGHADGDRSDDVDFGADHPTAITADELGILSRWIDTGAGWGTDFDADGADPVLHLTAVAEDGAVTALRIGTTDVGSGIDVGSLTACVVPSGSSTCGPNLAGAAAAAGVVTLALASPLADPDAEVWASVKDLAGHVTEVHRTVRYLLSLPAPSVDVPDAGVADGGPDAVSPEPVLPGHGCGCAVGARAPAAVGLGACGLLLALLLLALGRARR